MKRLHWAVGSLLFAGACVADEPAPEPTAQQAQESTSQSTGPAAATCDTPSGPTSSPGIADASACGVAADVRASDALTASLAAAPPACDVFAGPNHGAAICGTTVQVLTRTNALKEIFIVGLDYAVWHAWQNPSGSWTQWHSLGGQVFCRDHAPCDQFDGVAMPVVSDAPVISVLGLDGRLWCRAWPWTVSWHPC